VSESRKPPVLAVPTRAPGSRPPASNLARNVLSLAERQRLNGRNPLTREEAILARFPAHEIEAWFAARPH